MLTQKKYEEQLKKRKRVKNPEWAIFTCVNHDKEKQKSLGQRKGLENIQSIYSPELF